MAEQTKTETCVIPGAEHKFEFVTAAHGYQCFRCAVCGHYKDEAEDSQP